GPSPSSPNPGERRPRVSAGGVFVPGVGWPARQGAGKRRRPGVDNDHDAEDDHDDTEDDHRTITRRPSRPRHGRAGHDTEDDYGRPTRPRGRHTCDDPTGPRQRRTTTRPNDHKAERPQRREGDDLDPRGRPVYDRSRIGYGAAMTSLEYLRRLTQEPTPTERREEILADPGFGNHFTDHMITVTWTAEKGWHDAELKPYGPFQLDPATAVLHYAQEVFEGLKAYRHEDGSI